ncbi:MAG: Ig-like domain-containing protein [Verrucomicrobiota bacterium]|nr:Ig-like domain-containing protein [Verrucomicrobiota bacterium]
MTNRSGFFSVLLILFLSNIQILHAQNIPNLDVQIVSSPTSAKIGSTIGVTVLVSNVGNQNVAAAENITVTVELQDPSGNVVQKSDGTPIKHIQILNGLGVGNTAFIENDPTTNQVLLQIPWSEGSKWDFGPDDVQGTNDDAWRVVAFSESAALETDLTNNSRTSFLHLDLPNLEVRNLQISGTLMPGSNVFATATIANTGNVRTQEGIFFGVTASLSNIDQEFDSEMSILPRLTTSAGVPLVYIDEGDEVTVNFPPLRIPVDAEGDLNVSIEVDPSNPDIIHETSETDNGIFRTITVDTPAFNLAVDPDSFKGDIGAFKGLDPIRIAFSLRNEGGRELRTGDNFVVRAILSENSTFDGNDMILREFDINGGTGLGGNLKPNENISFDWVQQLPDNFEGDYYMLINVESDISSTTFFAENTPTITLESKNKLGVEQLSLGNPQATERPSVSADGRYVTFEQLDANGIQQVWFQDTILNTPPILISRALGTAQNGNGHSLRPQISADGLSIVFHSFASNLVPDDKNALGDVFLYRVLKGQLVRAYNSFSNLEGNGGSYYPSINGDGSKVVFQSRANNLDYTGVTTSSQQIFLWNTNIGTFGTISALTSGNEESRHPSIDNNGEIIVFESDADNLTISDQNDETDIFAFKLDTNETWLVSVNEFEQQADGPSIKPVISGNGEVVAYESLASNLVRARGISVVSVVNGGVGYYGNPTINVTDGLGNGSGAVLSISNGINQYGQILPDGVEILFNGRNYLDPVVTIIPDPNQPPPVQEAIIKAHLSHPEGEIYRVELGDPDDLTTIANSLKRVSENFNGIGGTMRSREATIDFDGDLIAYSTKSSNLLDANITRADGAVFYNQPARLAKARAIVVGPIGEIEVNAPGIGYQNGFLKIDDLSGSGSGATADYEVDALGRISSINIINSGQNYNLDRTVVSVLDARGGTGFNAGTIRFPFESGVADDRVGGGRVYRVEMLEHGMGYKNVENSNNGLDSLIQIQGDGVDTDGDGKPDAKVDPSAIQIDSMGGVYLTQKFYFEILSSTSLLGTKLELEDDNRSIEIEFSMNDAGAGPTTVQIGVPGAILPLSEIRDRVINVINSQWNNPNTLMEGPIVVPGFGNDFTLDAISGRFEVDNPTSIRIDHLSNMLFSGDGYTRATPNISPTPSIHGYSEVLAGTNTTATENSQLLLDSVVDHDSDDIYLYYSSTGKNERISRSKFGYPFNFLPETEVVNTPNSRFPSISGNGRHLLFSTDATGLGGLAFGTSNQQIPNGAQQDYREVVRVDLKKRELTAIDINVEMLFPNDYANVTFGTNSRIPVIANIKYDDDDISNVVLVVDNQIVGALNHFQGDFSTNRYFGSFNTGLPGEHVYQVVAINDLNDSIGASTPRTVTVKGFDSFPPSFDLQDLNTSNVFANSMSNTSSIRLNATGSDPDGTVVAVQYYVDGIPYGEEIPRRPGVDQGFSNYPINLSSEELGIRSVFAIGRDTSNNYVASDIYNISVSPGTEPPLISMVKGPKSYEIKSDNFNINIDSSTNEILSIDLLEPFGENLIGQPLLNIFGTGTGANAIAVVENNTTSVNYGKIVALDVQDGGEGYDSNISISIVPVLNNIGYGEEAILGVEDESVFNQGNPFNPNIGFWYWSYYVGLQRDVSGSPLGGYGYTVSPRLQFQDYNGTWLTYSDQTRDFSRLPLVDNNQTTSSVADFAITRWPYRLRDYRLLGGFTQSSTFFEFNVTAAEEPIKEVQLYVNGELVKSKVSPPYAFSYCLDEVGDYDVYGVVKDTAGNVSTTEPSTITADYYKGSGVTFDFNIDSNFSVPAQTKTIFTAKASSDTGVAEVEFYINDKSYGKAFGDGHTEAFIKEVDLRGLNQGRHDISLVARDYQGNEAGTFNRMLTNIEIRQNKILEISPKLASSQAPEISLVFPHDKMMMTSSSEIYLSVDANDTDGKLVGVQFYVDGEKYGDELLFDPSYSQEGYPYGIKWGPGLPGVYVINAVARDTSGNKSLSNTATVTSTSGNSLVPNVSIEALNPSYESNETVFISTEVTDESNGSNGIGVVELVQFFANGVEIASFDRSPYFATWLPEKEGTYEVYAMAKDNEGNYAISEIQKTTINSVDEFSQSPNLGSLYPSASGSASALTVIRRSGRRTQDGLQAYTLISGFNSNFLDELTSGQVIRFERDGQMTNEYTVSQINNNNELEIVGELTPTDLEFLNNLSSLQLVEVFRAGSRIALNLKPTIDSSNFNYVDFYADGLRIRRDQAWPFSAIFLPVYEGNYTISVVASNDLGNQTLYSERIYVSPKLGLAPDGAVGVIPSVTRNNSVSIGSELTIVADFEDLDDGINRVEFFLNGALKHVDREKPYHYKFRPESDASIDLTDRGWEVTAVGIDNSGNRISVASGGNINGSVVMPEAYLKTPTNGEEFSDGQSIEIRVEIKGTNIEELLGMNSSVIQSQPNQNLTPRSMNLFANGQMISIGKETSWGSGLFVGEWICDSDYAGASGEIDIFGGIVMENITEGGQVFTPTVFSDVATITVLEPNLAADPESAVNQTFNDLLGYSPTEQQLTNSVTEEMDDGGYLFDNEEYLAWASSLSERDLFENMVDTIGGYHTMTGLWPEPSKIDEIMNKYSASPNNGSDGSIDGDGDGFSLLQERLFGTSDQDPIDFPNSAFSMGSFVDDTLSSRDYTDIHGPVPVLTPPEAGADRFVNYDANRRDFVRVLYNNKYGTPPTVSQEIQGSYRISVFDPNSEEAKLDSQRQMMQQLAMYSSLGVGGLGGGGRGGGGNNNQLFASLLGGLNNNNQNQQTGPTFNNPGGQPAVLFVTNMIAEKKIDNQNMIWGANSKRDYYKTAALITSYWGENLDALSDELISQYHGMETEKLISVLMKDRRYFSRFGGYSVTRLAEEIPDAPGWKWLEWLGHFSDEKFPWIYHSGLGWIYMHGPSDEQTWFYIPNAGWLGTTKEVWQNMNSTSAYLWLYEQATSRWVAYVLEQPAGKTFWDPSNQTFFRYE